MLTQRTRNSVLWRKKYDYRESAYFVELGWSFSWLREDPSWRSYINWHPGMVRMKALARSFVWWPGIDGDIEEFVKECNPCQRSRLNPPATYLHPWERPAKPWERIHVDYASVEVQNGLILIDAHSKWIKAIPTSSMTAGMTVRTMRGGLRNPRSTKGSGQW